MNTLFVTDLDGTLLTKEERVSPYSRERLNKLIGEGMRFTFATARSVLSARRATEGLTLSAPAILYNGGLIYDLSSGEVLSCTVFGKDEAEYILSVLSSFGITPIVFGAEEGRERLAYDVRKETEGIERYLFRRREDPRLTPVVSREGLLSGHIFYFKCICPHDDLALAWDALKYDPRFICIFHREVYAEDYWMEISPRAATKANGVRFLRDRLGFDRVVCFGDTSNDSDMFDVCEEKYAVKNADEWLCEKATDVIGYCEEDGVAKWLEAHFDPISCG